MIALILLAALLELDAIVAFALWCCYVVAVEADRPMEALERQRGEADEDAEAP